MHTRAQSNVNNRHLNSKGGPDILEVSIAIAASAAAEFEDPQGLRGAAVHVHHGPCGRARMQPISAVRCNCATLDWRGVDVLGCSAPDEAAPGAHGDEHSAQDGAADTADDAADDGLVGH